MSWFAYELFMLLRKYEYFRTRICFDLLKITEKRRLKVKWLIQNQNQIIILPLIWYQILTLLLNLALTLNLNLIFVQCLWIKGFVFSLYYIWIPLNKPADGFFIYSDDRINSYVSNGSIMHIFFWHIYTQKVCFYYTIKFSYFIFQVFLLVNRFPMKFNA